MSEHDDENVVIEASPHRPHRVAVMVVFSIAAALVLVSVALWLYNTSGTAQLDLSRPNYESVRDKVSDDEVETFPSTGSMDQTTIEKFRRLFDDQAQKATMVDGYGSGALDDAALGLPVVQPEATD